jgi:sugar phosphate isomerase/epimerase
MQFMKTKLSRRKFVATTGAAAAWVAGGGLAAAAESSKGVKNREHKICAFEKPLQGLSYDELADFLAELGFNGVEATVRAGGHVLPEHAEEDLPRMVRALNKRGIEMTVLTSDINSVSSPHADRVLRIAAKLGVKRYRMLWYRYDLKKPVAAQLEEIRPKLSELAAMNRKLGVTALYQNHSGAQYVGSALWDSYSLIKEFDPKEIGLAYDIHHATVEGGLNWPVQFNLVRSHIQTVYVKDFVWDNRKVKDVPLGQGKVDPAFFTLLKQSDFDGPISMHVEYLESGHDRKELADAFKKDFGTLKSWLDQA